MRQLLLAAFMISAIAVHAQTADEYLTLADENHNNDNYTKYLLLADSFAHMERDTQKMAVANHKLGHYYYTRNADKAIHYLGKAYIYYSAADDANNAIFCLQNIAFAYEEKKNDLTSAERYVKMAIAERKDRKDTLQLANMYKYLGYLQGKSGQYAEAKENVKTAISMFDAKKYDMGKAVSYYDMGKVYEYQQKYDSALHFYMASKAIWVEHGNQQKRIFNVNNGLLHVYTLSNDIKTANEIRRDNELILGNWSIYWSDKLDFYKYSAELLQKQGNKKQAVELKTKYQQTKDSLKKEGIWIGE